VLKSSTNGNDKEKQITTRTP